MRDIECILNRLDTVLIAVNKEAAEGALFLQKFGIHDFKYSYSKRMRFV